MIKKFVFALAVGSMALGTAACNTMRGAVDDVESVGDCVDGVEGNC